MVYIFILPIINEHARASRLVSERDGLDEIVWNPELDQFENVSLIERLKTSQTNEFVARAKSLNNQKAILRQRIEQINAEKTGINSQIASQRRQISLLEDEIESMERLFEKGFTGKARLRELQRNLVNVKGQRSQNFSAISRIDQ